MRIALLGVGRLGASHAATLASLPEVDELRVYDSDEARAREVAARLGARAVSSAMITTGFRATAIAIAARCFSPNWPDFCAAPK